MFGNRQTHRRKRQNQRIGKRRRRESQLHQLDVKMCSRRAIRQRNWSLAVSFIKFAAIVATLISLTATIRWTYNEFFYENRDFRLADLQIETDGVLTPARVVKAAGIEEGMGLLKIDLEKVRRDISDLPMVERVEVTRELPNRLAIAISERRPVAWLSCPPKGIRPRNSNTGHFVDRAGHIMPCESLIRDFMDLPVIETYALSRVVPGSRVESDEVMSAIDLISRSNRRLADRGMIVSEVRVRNGYSLAVSYSNDMVATFGMKDFDRALNDLALIVDHPSFSGRNLASVNLLVNRNIPVTFYDAPVPAQLPGAQKTEPANAADPESPPSPASSRSAHLKSILRQG